MSFISGIVLGLLLMTAWYYGGFSAPTSSANDASQAASSTPVGNPSGAVSVSNQPAGSIVIVDSVTVPPPGVWVAIREVNDGTLGNVLGAARVGGPRLNISVPLLRATTPGDTYAVELYRDSGDSMFDLSTESVYVDFDTGERVVAYFQTTN